MFPEQIDLDESKIKELTARTHECFFRSNFKFLKAHNGIRRNKLHLLLSPTSGGKSTMVRSLLCDMVFRNKDKKILLWLTEESKSDFLTEFAATVPPHEVLSNIRIVSEMDTTHSDSEILATIEQTIDYYKVDMIIIDNITTSRFYGDKATADQFKMSMWYKGLLKKTTVFLIAHTNGNDYNNRLLDETDIRGSKSITNLAEFLYILQPMYVGDKLYQFINIKKHRGQNIGGRFFRMFYSDELKSFDRDVQVSFEGVKEFFAMRNQLGK